jgi:hypothetical protein
MADSAGLSPEQLLMLSRLGTLQSGGMSGFGASSGNEFVNTSVQGFNAPSADFGNASFNVGGNILDNARLQAGLNTNYVSSGGQTELNPNISAQFGPASLMYGQQYKDGQRQGQSVGGGYNFGPASVNINRLFNNRGPDVTSYNLAMPTEYGNINAGMVRGKGVPTAYQGGVQIPGLLGGDASVVGEYVPSRKDVGVYGRYSRRF